MFKDRVFVGFIAGVLAAIGADIANWISFGLGFSELRFLEWASIIFLGHLPNGLAEVAVTQMVQVIWDGLLGVIFILIIPIIKSDFLVYKGMMFGFSLLFAFRAISVAFSIPYLNDISLTTFLSHILCSIVWGTLVGLIIQRLYAFADE